MAVPVVLVTDGGLPVAYAANGLGLPLVEASNGFGTPVTLTEFGAPVVFVSDGVFPRSGALADYDFVGDRYSGPALTVTRASTGYVDDLAGNWTAIGANTLRRSNKGVLIEDASTNLFLNSLTPATQTITVVNGTTYAVSLFATGGTLTLSGAATGTVTANGSQTFVASGTSLTVTVAGVTGTFQCVNVEAKAFRTSPIATAGTSATRNADIVTATITAPTEATIAIVGRPNTPIANASLQGATALSDGTLTNRAYLVRSATSGFMSAAAAPGGSASSAPAVAPGDRFGAAGSFGDAYRAISVNGGAPVTSVAAGAFPSGLTQLRVGDRGNGTFLFNGFIERLSVFASRLSEQRLRTLSMVMPS